MLSTTHLARLVPAALALLPLVQNLPARMKAGENINDVLAEADRFRAMIPLSAGLVVPGPGIGQAVADVLADLRCHPWDAAALTRFLAIAGQPPDGPRPPDGFCLSGKSIRHLTPTQFRLLALVWGGGTAPRLAISVLQREAWRDKPKAPAIGTVIEHLEHLNDALSAARCGWSLNIKGIFAWLERP